MNQFLSKTLRGAMLLLLFAPFGAQAIAIQTASVGFNPKKTDSFQVLGTFDNLALDPAGQVQFDFGGVSQTIPVSSFIQKKDIYTFKAPKNAVGIANFTINLKKHTFLVKGKNLVLSELNNPLAVRLVTTDFDECSMPLFKDTPKKWTFNSKKNQQFLCQITDLPLADPNGFFINTSTQVRVQARINPSPILDSGSVQIFEVNPATQTPIGEPLCSPLDNGSLGNGDDIGGDNVYSCYLNFDETAPRTISLIVKATVNSGAAEVFSPKFVLNAVEQIADAAAEGVSNDQAAAEQAWQEQLAALGDTKKARIEAIKAIKKMPGVVAAGLSKDGVSIWIKYDSGVIGGLMLNPEGTRGSSMSPLPGPRLANPKAETPWSNTLPALFTRQTKTIPGFLTGFNKAKAGLSIAKAATDHPVGNNKVLVWDAYNFQFAPFDEGPGLQTLFHDSQCPTFDVTYLKDNAATVDSVRNFANYGTVIMVTHGAVDGDGQVVFLTTEQANAGSIVSHALDLLLGRIIVMGNVFAIRPAFIRSLPGNFESSVIYNGSCQSSANNTMANAFFGKGANTYYAFTRVVNSDFAQNVSTQLFTSMVTNLKNTGDAFTPVAPKVDPGPPHATFTQGGDDKTIYSTEFKNGDFETGDLTGWVHSGDGRVVSGLGEFSPYGNFMGLISTGLGYTTSSGEISQSFCLDPTATHLNFNWNFSSEEFREYCNSAYDDNFDVEMVTPSGTNALFHTSVNDLCASGPLSLSGLHFDRGDDGDVFSTGWISQSVDIAAIATANNGKGVRLIFKSSDVGDSIYDTAILLDDIQLVSP